MWEKVNKIGTQNIIAVILSLSVVLFFVCLLLVKIPSENKELLHSLLNIYSLFVGAASGWLYNASKNNKSSQS